jgi:DNA polymerase-4
MILHIDMDAFYAAVEQLDRPELRGRCVIVGGSTNRGVVSAASYEARRFGVRSAMPIFEARRKCPEGCFVHPRMDRYREVSRAVMALLTTFTPLVEPVSIDEAYLDLAGCCRLHGPPLDIGRRIKQQIKAAVGLTCSVGIAPNRFLAKIASEMDKPDGLTLIAAEAVPDFVARLPIGRVPGVGEKTMQILTRMGIHHLGDVRQYPAHALINRLGKYGRRLMALAAGIDTTPVTPHSPHKSVSTERTLDSDTRDRELLVRLLLKFSEEVAAQLRKLDVRARTLTLKIKHADFRQVTRSTTLPKATQSSDTVYREAVRLLDAYRFNAKVRLIGIGASNLTANRQPTQLNLFDRTARRSETWEKVDQTVEKITAKFGSGTVQRAVLKEKE